MLDMRFDVDTHGPVFSSGESGAVMHAAKEDVEETLAEKAKEKIDRALPRVLKHPTGYYQSQIHVASAEGGHVVNDGGVVYGPWLEGVGSRNRTTRFKGYFTFRRVTQEIETEAEPIAERQVAHHVRRLT